MEDEKGYNVKGTFKRDEQSLRKECIELALKIPMSSDATLVFAERIYEFITKKQKE